MYGYMCDVIMGRYYAASAKRVRVTEAPLALVSTRPTDGIVIRNIRLKRDT